MEQERTDVALSDEERREIDEELSHLPTRQAACIEALKIVQRHRGWVSDDSLKVLAEYLGMSVSALDNVATFYSLIFREPVGRHVILVCNSISCWVMGYEELINKLKETLKIDLGGTTEDGRFTLLTIPCLGTCDHAPAIIIDTDTHRDLTPEKLDDVLEQYK
jgi:NADH-quinone oxidoreductase subunit E